MLNLFNKYKNESKISQALLVGRNMVNKDPGNFEMFKEYIDLLISLAQKLPSFDERKNFTNLAGLTLSFFEENADLSDEMVEEIFNYKQQIDDILNDIRNIEDNNQKAYLKEISEKNSKKIVELYNEKQKLSTIKTKAELDHVLEEIAGIDAEIEHDYLTEEQNANYNKLNKECTALISNKMREIERNENLKYNEKAVELFKYAFKTFKNDENRYKDQTQLFSLVSKTLFSVDASRLFNETLIYYNHVYSYIFDKLDEDGKFALTKFSITCEQKMR